MAKKKRSRMPDKIKRVKKRLGREGDVQNASAVKRHTVRRGPLLFWSRTLRLPAAVRHRMFIREVIYHWPGLFYAWLVFKMKAVRRCLSLSWLSVKIRLDRRRFKISLIVLVGVLIWLASMESGFTGRLLLDKALDFVVRRDYEYAVIKGHEAQPVSNKLDLVIFDRWTYETSYTHGYWTPRDEVGLTVLNALKRKAKVIVLDFDFARSSPVVWNRGRLIFGDGLYIRYLQQAAAEARQNQAVIITPLATERPVPAQLAYRNWAEANSDVVIPASFKALRSGLGPELRRFVWFDYDQHIAPVPSASLTSLIVANYSGTERDAAIIEAKKRLIGLTPDTDLLPDRLKESLRPGQQEPGSRLIYRILPRETVKREFGSGPDIVSKKVWRPSQVNNPNFDLPNFENKVVLIGSDYKHNSDYHQTAFGELPGSYILANSINMILNERISQESLVINWGFMILVGLLACWAFSALNYFGATVLFFVSSLGLRSVSAWIFFRYGLFFDVWLPFYSVGLVNTLMALNKWRTFLGGQGLIHKIIQS